MTALRSAGRSEAFADRRASLGVLATLGLPVSFLAFIVHASFGQLGILFFVGPLTVVIGVVAAGFLYAVANSAFAAATLRRRERYELLSSVGAQRQHLTKLLAWELGLPAAIGIGCGLLVGVAAAQIAQPFGFTFDSNELSLFRTVTGLIGTAVVVGGPAIAGVWAAARSSAARIGEPRGSAQRPDFDVPRARRTGLVALAVSVPVLVLSLLAFSFSFRYQFLQPFEQLAWFGLILGVLGTLAGVALLIPTMLELLAARSARGGTASALKGLAENPRRAMGFTAAVLTLSTLTVMAAAGIASDADQADDPGDRRQIVATEFGVTSGFVEEVAQRHGNPITGIARFQSFGGRLFEPQFVNEIARGSFDTAPLTDDLIAVLEFTEEDVEFARQGGLLVDSDIVVEVVALGDAVPGESFETTPVEIRRVRRGGGVGQPGAAVYGFFDLDAPPSEVSTFSLVRFEESLSDAMIDDFSRSPSIPELPREGTPAFLGPLMLAVIGALLFTLALSASNLAAVEQDEEFSTMVALGASPNVRPRALAMQLAWQLGLGIAVGSTLGVLLFWVVTRGDSSVPTAVVPISVIAALGVAAVAAVAIAALLHGPAEPAVSSRVSATVEV